MHKYMNISRYLLLIFIIVSPAIAETPVDLKKEMAKCAAIENSVERLAAYDKLAEKMGVASPKSTVVTGMGKWRLQTDVSPIDDSKSYFLILESEDEVAGMFGTSYKPSLYIRFKEGVLEAYITYNTYIGTGEVDVTTRFDKNEAETESWGLSTDGKAVFAVYATSFIQSVVEAKTLVVRLTPYGESPITVSFDLRGIDKAIKPIHESINK